MADKLLIVESPTKAKTIGKFLGKGYKVISSFGHIRDLPKKEMGVDIKNNFKPTYIVPDDKKDKVKALKDAAKSSGEVYLATDEDREGEAIAWHIAGVLGLEEKTAKRITFHEITKSAIDHALESARTLDMRLVDAQQARRILDRLVGYELSPFLWKKVRRGLSAGRVQSVAVRLVVERERERLAFKVDEYWSIEAMFEKFGMPIEAKLTMIGDKKVEKLDIKNEAEAQKIVEATKGADFTVTSIETKEATRKPPVPLATSALQQEAYNRLGMSAKQTMTLAQKLYETGHITYMRTDSLNLSEQFLTDTQAYVQKNFGSDYAKGAVHFKTNKKGAQEAHEAIRPTDVNVSPESLQGKIDPGMARLYDLIWRRTVASQLPAAKIRRTGIDLTGNAHTFRANGSTVVFDGFMKVWQASEDKLLPALKEGENIGKAKEVTPNQHFTEPTARYSDATLIKALEEYGIGRPSTYAPTLATIESREYVLRDDNKKLYPSDIAMVVTDLLTEHFPQIVDYEFTANMEKKFDDIADGEEKWTDAISHFYTPFHKLLGENQKNLEKVDLAQERSLGIDPKSGLEVFARTGRFGPFVTLGVESKEKGAEKPKRASLEKHQTLDTITLEDALKLFVLPRTLGKHENGEDIIANTGRFGPYLKCGEVNITLPPAYDPKTMTLEQAIEICSEGMAKKLKMATPIAELGEDPETKTPILVKNGRYGPYITDGTTNVTVPKNVDPASVTREEAIDLLIKKRKAPKKRWVRKEKSTEA
jgi:DNA topoisomerase-1